VHVREAAQDVLADRQHGHGRQLGGYQEAESERNPHLPQVEQTAVTSRVPPEAHRVADDGRRQSAQPAEGDPVGVEGSRAQETGDHHPVGEHGPGHRGHGDPDPPRPVPAEVHPHGERNHQEGGLLLDQQRGGYRHCQ
jgi:hypothetical protein